MPFNPKIKIVYLFLFLVTTSFSQDKVKISLDGEDKIEFINNNLGDLRLRWILNPSGSDNLFIGNAAGQAIVHNSNNEGFYNTAVGNYAFGQIPQVIVMSLLVEVQ